VEVENPLLEKTKGTNLPNLVDMLIDDIYHKLAGTTAQQKGFELQFDQTLLFFSIQLLNLGVVVCAKNTKLSYLALYSACART